MQELKRLRLASGLSQGELAAASGVDRATISLIETGHRKPSLETLEKLAPALDAEMADFFPKVQAPLFDFDSAERAKLGDVTSERQRAELDAELRRLYLAWEAGEIRTAEYSAAVMETINATLDTAARASREAG